MRFKSVLFEAVCEAVQQDRSVFVREEGEEGSTSVTTRGLVTQVRSPTLASVVKLEGS